MPDLMTRVATLTNKISRVSEGQFNIAADAAGYGTDQQTILSGLSQAAAAGDTSFVDFWDNNIGSIYMKLPAAEQAAYNAGGFVQAYSPPASSTWAVMSENKGGVIGSIGDYWGDKIAGASKDLFGKSPAPAPEKSGNSVLIIVAALVSTIAYFLFFRK